MEELNLRAEVQDRFRPFLEEVLGRYEEKIHSIYVTGSALTRDYDPKRSDINSVVVLKSMDLKVLELLAPLGKTYAKRKVSSPLIMTPDYISKSLDVFPLEFLNIKMLHQTVHGKDLFQEIEIGKSDLRRQCERELKVRQIGLSQGYLSSAGDRKHLTQGFISSVAAYIPLFRGILFVLGQAPPAENDRVLTDLKKATGVDTRVFKKVLQAKREEGKLSKEELDDIFENYYHAIETLGKIVDEIPE